MKFRDWSPYRDNYRYGYRVGQDPPRICDLFVRTSGIQLENFYKNVRQALIEKPVLIPLVIGQNDEGIHMIDAGKEGNNLFISGMTGSGKTNLVYQILLGLLVNTSSKFCKITALDHSKGYFFKFNKHINIVHGEENIFNFLKELKQDMLSRFELIKGFEKISEFNKKKQRDRSESVLPYHIIFFDELAAIKANKGMVELLNSILEQCRSAGIIFVCATQLPYAKNIDSRIRSHFINQVCLRMANSNNEGSAIGSRKYNVKLLDDGQMVAFLERKHLLLKSKYHTNSDLQYVLYNLSRMNNRQPTMRR